MASATPRQMTGTFRTPDGSAFPNRSVTFFRDPRGTYSQGGVVVADEVKVVTLSSTGAINVSLIAGEYLAMVRLDDADRYFRVVVPDREGPHNIAQYIGEYPRPGVIDAILTAASDAVGAAQGGWEALDAAIAAEVSARDDAIAVETKARAEGEALAAYRAALWHFTGKATDPQNAPIYVSGDNRVMLLAGHQQDDLATYRSSLWQFTGEANDPLAAPISVSLDNRILLGVTTSPGTAATVADLPYIEASALRIATPRADRLLNDAYHWRAAALDGGGVVAIRDRASARELVTIGRQSGDIYPPPGVIDLRLGVGQSNGRGSQSGRLEGAEILQWPVPYQASILMPGSDVWAGTGNSSAVVFNPASLTELRPYAAALSHTSGPSAVEAAAQALAVAADADGVAPRQLVANLAVGGSTMAQLMHGAESGATSWANLVAVLERIAELADAPVLCRWIAMHQGESNTSLATLGSVQDQYRADIQAEVQRIFGQASPVRMLAWQPGSYSTSTGARSILSHHLDVPADTRLYWCAGPSYPFEFVDQYLHHSALGHQRCGHLAAEIIRRIERGQGWEPLYMTHAAVSGANQITVTLTHAAEIDVTDPVVAPIDNAGITLAGGAVTNVSVMDHQLTITTAGAASAVTAVRAAMTGQTSPRTALGIPRTNIRASAPVGQYHNGAPMLRWLCPQEITI